MSGACSVEPKTKKTEEEKARKIGAQPDGSYNELKDEDQNSEAR
jgi:hypothetical protein